MSDEDDTNAPAVPRFVPTLTEVVDPAAAPQAPAPAPPRAAAAPASPLDAEALAQSLLAQIGPDLHAQVAEAVARVLHEQMLGFNARVQKTVNEVVRDAVAKAMARAAHGIDDGKNP